MTTRQTLRLMTPLSRHSSNNPGRLSSGLIGHRFSLDGGRQTQIRLGSGPASFNQPSGWLFGEKPLPKGQKRVREDWELIWYIGFWGTTLMGVIMHIYKPDRSIQTWARKEAELKMDKLPTYEKS